MISIIICSTHHSIEEGLRDNIMTTIGDGIDYEIVCIDNSDNRHSIFSAYNEGVKRAKGDCLCFMHEDVTFYSTDWGGECERQLKENQQIGLLGVLGGYYLSSVMAGWGSSGLRRGQILQGTRVKGKYTVKPYNLDAFNKYGNEVVCVDGLWLFLRRSLFDSGSVAWDVDSYSGFHFYDMDISMQVLRSGHTIAVADILLEHRSGGNCNRAFWEGYIAFHRKWAGLLPVRNRNIPNELIEQADLRQAEIIANDNITILEYKELLGRLHFYQIYGVYTRLKLFFVNIISKFAMKPKC